MLERLVLDPPGGPASALVGGGWLGGVLRDLQCVGDVGEGSRFGGDRPTAVIGHHKAGDAVGHDAATDVPAQVLALALAENRARSDGRGR